jgi:hypothetical protein
MQRAFLNMRDVAYLTVNGGPAELGTEGAPILYHGENGEIQISGFDAIARYLKPKDVTLEGTDRGMITEADAILEEMGLLTRIGGYTRRSRTGRTARVRPYTQTRVRATPDLSPVGATMRPLLKSVMDDTAVAHKITVGQPGGRMKKGTISATPRGEYIARVEGEAGVAGGANKLSDHFRRREVRYHGPESYADLMKKSARKAAGRVPAPPPPKSRDTAAPNAGRVGVAADDPAYSPSGNVRNFGAMSEDKLTALASEIVGHSDPRVQAKMAAALRKKGLDPEAWGFLPTAPSRRMKELAVVADAITSTPARRAADQILESLADGRARGSNRAPCGRARRPRARSSSAG